MTKQGCIQSARGMFCCFFVLIFCTRKFSFMVVNFSILFINRTMHSNLGDNLL